MIRIRQHAAWLAVALALTLAAPALAQKTASSEGSVDADEVRRLREQAEAEPDEATRSRLFELYDDALASLARVERNDRAVRRFERDRAGIDRRIEAVKSELARAEVSPRRPLPDGATLEQAESALARERARLAAHREQLRDAERRAEERATKRNDISRRIGTIDQEIEAIEDELRALRLRDLPVVVSGATELELRSRREAERSEIAVGRAELAWLEALGSLLPWETDLAQRRVTGTERLVGELESNARILRREAASRARTRALETCAAAAELSPELAELAAETEALVELRWGQDNVAALADRVSTDLLAANKNDDELDRVVQLTRRLFLAYGRRGSIQRWWPQVDEDFPEARDLERRIRAVQQELPEVQHELIRVEQRRSRARQATELALASLADEGGTIEPAAEKVALDLLNLRRDLLDELIVIAGRYADVLVEYEGTLQRLADRIARVESFLYERVLWSRSVPRPVFPRPAAVRAAGAWWLAKDRLGFALGALARGLAAPGPAGLALVAAALLVLRRRIGTRLAEAGARERDEASFRATLSVLACTAALAAPAPLAILAAARACAVAGGSPFVDAASEALTYTAAIAGVLAIARWIAAPGGIAAVHLDWRETTRRRVHRAPIVAGALCLPLLALALHLVFVGGRLTSEAELQAHHNALGRVAFVVAFAVLGATVASLARSRRPRSGSTAESRLRRGAVGVQAFAVGVTIVTVALALAGYYVTALLLGYQLLRMAWLALAIGAVGFVLWRWYIASSRASGDPSTHDGQERVSDDRARVALRFTLGVAAALGLYGIWAEAVPLLQLLKRVELWPSVRVASTVADPFAEADLVFAAAPSSSESDAPEVAESTTGAVPGAAVVEGSRDEAATEGAPAEPLTLWRLIQAILAAIATAVLARSLPELIDTSLRGRARTDRGARVALSTLVRYGILIVGLSTVFGLLGVSWSKVQWLAAALTFGLGFGLQEIVANFVSGLILLLERPVRVGDAVTVGNLQGIVSQIQIRATTITLWDRSEMVVPNKEFITTKLINWTLSDSKRRSEIPLRIGYGSDVDAVKRTLVEVARAHPNVLDDPAPHVLLMDFEHDAIKVELRFFVDFGQGLSTKDDLLVAIDRAFRERGIEFAMPRLQIDERPAGPRDRRRDPGSEPGGSG